MKVHSSLLLALAAICLFASAVAVQDKDCGVNCPDNDIDPTDSNDPSQFKVIEPEKALRGFESWHRGFKYKSGIFRRSSSDNLTPDESKDPIDLSKLTHTPTYLPDRGDDDHPVGDVDDALRGFNEWHKQFWHKTMVETLDSNLPKPSAAPGQTPKATSTPSPAPSTNQGSNQVTVCSGKVCPHANAVCCEGKDFCCPQGYRCSDQTLDSNSTGTIPPCIADSSAKVGPQTSLGGSSSAVVSSSASSSPCSASDNQCQTTSAPSEVQKVDASVTPMPKAPIPGGCCDTCACAQPKPKEEDKSPIVVHIIPKIIFEEAPKEVASTSEESSEDGTPDTKGGVDNPADDSNATENSSESGEESGAEEDSEASAENSDDESSMAVENTEATSEESTEPAGESTTDSTADEGTDEGAADEGAADEGAADESATDESAADESTESAASL